MPLRVLLSPVIEQRTKSRDADGHVSQALAPRPPEGVADDHRHLFSGLFGDRIAQPAGGGVGVFGQQRDPAFRDIRGVHAGIGADQAVVRLDHNHAGVHADNPAALAQHHLDLARVFPELFRYGAGVGGGRDMFELHNPPLRLGDNLLRHNQHITVGDGQVMFDQFLTQQLRQRRAGGNFRQAGDGPNQEPLGRRIHLFH